MFGILRELTPIAVALLVYGYMSGHHPVDLALAVALGLLYLHPND